MTQLKPIKSNRPCFALPALSLGALLTLSSNFAHANFECPENLKRYQDSVNETKVVWCQKEDKKEGPLEVYDSKGNFLLKSNYQDNKLHGKFKRYFADGKLNVEGEYTDGIASGEWTRYWPSGNIRDQGPMLAGKPAGSWKFYDSSGKLRKEKKAKNEYVIENEFHARFTMIHVEAEHMLSTKDTENASLGLDSTFLSYSNWFNFRAAIDLARVRWETTQYFPFMQQIKENMWITHITIGPEFHLPFAPQWSLSPRFGRTWFELDKNFPGDSSHEVPSEGMEFRYKFSKLRFWKMDSIYFYKGEAGRHEKNIPDTQISHLGVTFLLN